MATTIPLRERIPATPIPALPDEVAGVTWAAASSADIDAMVALHAVADPLDHPTYGTPRGEVADRFTSSWIDPSHDIVVGRLGGDRVVAYGQAGAIPGTEDFAEATMSGVVHPEFRNRGIGGALLDWRHARALEYLSTVDAPVEGRITVHTPADQHSLHRLLERRGYTVLRRFDELSRDVSAPIPEAPVPEGLELVDYSELWSAATLDAKNTTFADHWGSLPESAEYWAQRGESGGLRPDASKLLIEGDSVAAFVLTTVNEDDWSRLEHRFGYITLVGVRRKWRGRGAARALLAAVLTSYRQLGWQRASLHVDTTSPTGADGLYRKLGFAPVAADLVYGLIY